MIWVQGKPSKFSTTIKDDNFHLIPVDYAKSLQLDYLPAQLTSDDYPNLIPKGERIDTIAVPAVLAGAGVAGSQQQRDGVRRRAAPIRSISKRKSDAAIAWGP